MKKKSPLYNDEIQLIDLFKIIWDGKIKILLITIISILVGLVYSSQIPINYINSLTLNPSKKSEFIRLQYINSLLKTQRISQLVQPNLAGFINELEDYDEFLSSLKNTKKIQEIISKPNIKDQKIELFKSSKLLEIVKPQNNTDKYIINFKWHDPNEAKKILKETLNLTSINFKKSIVREKKLLLEYKKKLLFNDDLVRLEFLKEQSSIARELMIVDNQLDDLSLSDSSVSLRINTSDNAYFLRGYKAIDKEVELIENRDYKNIKFIEQEINNFEDAEIKFTEYNVNLMDHNSLKNTNLILVSYILLGLIIGIFYVFILNAFKSKKTN